MEKYIEVSIEGSSHGARHILIKESAIEGLAIYACTDDVKIHHEIIASGRFYEITKKQYDYLYEKIEVIKQEKEQEK